MNDHRRRLVLYVALGLLVAFIFSWLQRETVALHDLISDEQAEDRVEEADLCVRSWDTRKDLRDMAEAGYRRNAETLIAITQPDPSVEQAYRRQVELDVEEIRAELPDPDCDLDRARRTVTDSQE